MVPEKPYSPGPDRAAFRGPAIERENVFMLNVEAIPLEGAFQPSVGVAPNSYLQVLIREAVSQGFL